jgi:hypothetical protein
MQSGPAGCHACLAGRRVWRQTDGARPRRAQAGGEEGAREAPPPGLLLLLARLCGFMEGTAVEHVMETLAAAFPGRGGGSGGDQPPAFVAGEVARCAPTDAVPLWYGQV